MSNGQLLEGLEWSLLKVTQSDLHLKKLAQIAVAVCRMDQNVIEHTPGAQLVG